MALGPHHQDRIERLQAALEAAGVEALWIDPSVNLVYLTGLELLSLERLTALIVPARGELRSVVPLLLKDEFSVVEAEHVPWDDATGPEEATAKALRGISELHVLGSLQVWAYELLRGSGVSSVKIDDRVMAGLREIKDEREAELLARSGRVTDDIVTWLAGQDLAGATERNVAGRIRARYLELGYSDAECLVASGAGASMPHYAGGDAEIDATKPLLFDFGGVVDHYFSDMTRVFFPADLPPEIDEAYEVVLAAYDAALETVEPGTPCEEVDRAARRVIAEAGYGANFVHRTGHGLGLEVHEPPYLREGNATPLKTGHVFSIEPGIYVEGRFGLRYENIIHLGPGGPVELNTTPRRHGL